MLVNWKVEYCSSPPPDKQPPDYYIQGQPYWFFRYFKEAHQVDVADIHGFPWLEHWEKERLRFYVWQTLRVLPRLRGYDLILSHGMQSGVALSLLRRFFPIKAKHIVFDIGAFNSAAESGGALRLMQFASRSIDGIIYHTSRQREYYEKYFPWLVDQSAFIKFGTDADLFCRQQSAPAREEASYILCVGYARRDWETLYRAFGLLQEKQGHRVKLRLVGHPGFHAEDPEVESLPVLPLPELIREIRGALFCVLPLKSFLYSFGQMTLLQQMALGKAVVAARVPSMTDYVREGCDALLYEPGDAEDLCRRLEQLLTDEKGREEMGRRAADSILNRWNERHMAEEIEQYMKECMRK